MPAALDDFHPAVRTWFARRFERSLARARPRMARDRRRQRRARLRRSAVRADRQRQDPGRVHVGDRPASSSTPSAATAPRRSLGPLRLAAKGAGQRHPAQSRRAARRRAPASAPNTGFDLPRDSRRPSHWRHLRATSAPRCSGGRRISWSPRPSRCSSC